MSSLTCDGSGTFVGPTYTPTTSSYKLTTSTYKSTTTTYKSTASKASTTYYTPATFTTPTSIIGVADSASLFTSPTSSAASSAGGSGNIFTKSSTATTSGATTSSSSIGIVQSNDGQMVGLSLFGVFVAIVAGFLLL